MARLRRRRRDPGAAPPLDAPGPLYAPPEGRASPWYALFGNDRPVEIEIGPGRGDVLVAFATSHPERNFFGIEHVRGAAARVAARIHAAGLANARVLAADAACVVAQCVPRGSVAAYHVYFPDPWPKRRHHKRRVVTPAFAGAMARTLVAGGAVHVATDVRELFEEIAGVLVTAGFTPRDAVAPPRPTTRFERKYAAGGTYAASFTTPG